MGTPNYWMINSTLLLDEALVMAAVLATVQLPAATELFLWLNYRVVEKC
jgi:hypothetical protein